MNVKKIKVFIILSILLNVILGILLWVRYSTGSNPDKKGAEDDKDFAAIQARAETFVKKMVCDNLFYPNSYDPVKTSIDSVFYGPLTDSECVNAATELIDLRNQYNSAKQSHDMAVDQIKFFGRTDLGSSHWGKDRDEAIAEMKELQEKIEYQQDVIRNRDTSMDGEYYGWQVSHRYRAANSDGVVSFGNILFILNPELTECFFVYSLDDDDKNSINKYREVIETELGYYNNQ